jgi:hypothetical protein
MNADLDPKPCLGPVLRIRIRTDLHNFGRLKMEPCRVCVSLVADLHHFNMRSRIRIRVNVMWIRNTSQDCTIHGYRIMDPEQV